MPLELPDGEGKEVGPRFSYAVGLLSRSIRDALRNALEPFDLSVPEYTAMSVLSRRAGYSNAQLARRTLVSPQAMNEVIRSLESRGLLERTQSDSHKSVRHTHLTTSGRVLLERCDVVVDALEETMLAEITTSQRTELITFLMSRSRMIRESPTG